MTRKGKMLLLCFVLVLLVCSVSFTNVAHAMKNKVVVTATGEDTADCERPDLPGVFVTQDVCNVQAAVNANPGGRILLKGTFHFVEFDDNGVEVPGTDGTIFITNDIEIWGEKQGNKFLTKIKGGYYTFSIGYKPIDWEFSFFDNYDSLSDNAEPVSASIQDIEFENPQFNAIGIWATTGATIIGNRIIDGRAHSIEEVYGPGGHASGVGIFALPPEAFFADNPQLISGKIVIKDNYIDGMYRRAEVDDPWGAPSYDVLTRGLVQGGIWVGQYEADITIKDNEVYNTGFVGILANGSSGETTIKNNFVQIISVDDEILPDGIDGIEALGVYFTWGYENVKYIIADNEVVVGGIPNAWGISVDTVENAPNIRNNTVHLESGADVGIFLWDVSNATVSENIITGDSLYGIALGHWEWSLWLGNSGNIVKDNKLNNFNSALADYYLGLGVTNNALYVHKKDSVLNESGNDTNIIYR